MIERVKRKTGRRRKSLGEDRYNMAEGKMKRGEKMKRGGERNGEKR